MLKVKGGTKKRERYGMIDYYNLYFNEFFKHLQLLFYFWNDTLEEFFFGLVSYFGTRWLKEKLGNICLNSKYLSFCFEFFWVTVSN